jgi:arginine exporter protein ArgO
LDIDPVSGIVILIVAIIGIAILGYFGSAIIQSTDNPEIQKQVEETTEKGIDTIVLIVVLLGAIGTMGLIALFDKIKN